MDKQLHQAFIKQSIEKIFSNNFFCICDFEKVGDLMGVNVQQHPNYKYLHALHCVHYSKMEPVIIQNLQKMVYESLQPGVTNTDALTKALLMEGNDHSFSDDPYYALENKSN